MDQVTQGRGEPAAEGGSRQLTRAQFARLFQDAARKLWCIAAAVTGDPSQADDLVQEAAVIALNKIEQFDPSTSFVAWMGQIVRFISLNQRKRDVRRPPAAVDPASLAETVDPARRQDNGALTSDGRLCSDQSLFDDEVLRALGSLTETARACTLLRIVLELPYEEIGQALSIPPSTAMSHVHRSRERLREWLQGGSP